jgi:hypothetical protein
MARVAPVEVEVKVLVAPEGRPVSERVTVPENPLALFTVTAYDPCAPCWRLMDAGAERVNEPDEVVVNVALDEVEVAPAALVAETAKL